MPRPITQVLVPGRGHAVVGGRLTLTASSVARVETAADYYRQHQTQFEADGGLMVFEGGWAAAALGIGKPPEDLREGAMMHCLALGRGVAAPYAVASIESTTTMTNCLNAARFFRGVAQLAIVTQAAQADRFRFCVDKAMPDVAVTIIEAPGEDTPEVLNEERRMLHQSQLLYGWAKTPRQLRAADRLGALVGRVIGKQPGQGYNVPADIDI